jgi:hypothetical protein
MVNRIKNLYAALNSKGDFVLKLAARFDMKPMSIHNHWFGQYLAIPEHRQEEVLRMLEEEINMQNQLKKESA